MQFQNILLHTPRLQMRPVTIADVTNVHTLHSLPQIDQFNTLGIPDSVQQTQDLVHRWITETNATPPASCVFCIESKTKEFIGLIGITMGKPSRLSAEIGYKIDPSHWNKGYATEAVNEILNYCFTQLKLHRIDAGCATQNTASMRVLEKAGFTREGRKRKILPIRGEWLDNYFYAILEEDFLK
jgi:[ribosomal protein S5]-alanine N-acetyltransferase